MLGPRPLDEIEDGQHPHGAPVDPGPQTLGDAPGDVLVEAAAGDVGDALHRDLLQQGQHRLHVNFRRRQQRFAQGPAAQLRQGSFQVRMLHVEDLADQGEAVGMDAAGGQGDDHVPGGHGPLVDDPGPVHDARGVARQVVLVLRVEAGHLGGLAADEGRPRLDAAVAHALDDVRDPLRHVFAAGDIIEEKQGLGPAADDVVDAHGHAVHAHGVVLVHEKGQLQLGAHPVGARDQHRLGHAG